VGPNSTPEKKTAFGKDGVFARPTPDPRAIDVELEQLHRRPGNGRSLVTALSWRQQLLATAIALSGGGSLLTKVQLIHLLFLPSLPSLPSFPSQGRPTETQGRLDPEAQRHHMTTHPHSNILATMQVATCSLPCPSCTNLLYGSYSNACLGAVAGRPPRIRLSWSSSRPPGRGSRRGGAPPSGHTSKDSVWSRSTLEPRLHFLYFL
jgi:hypothetical protein